MTTSRLPIISGLSDNNAKQARQHFTDFASSAASKLISRVQTETKKNSYLPGQQCHQHGPPRNHHISSSTTTPQIYCALGHRLNPYGLIKHKNHIGPTTLGTATLEDGLSITLSKHLFSLLLSVVGNNSYLNAFQLNQVKLILTTEGLT